jgi:serine/threonine protein kinase
MEHPCKDSTRHCSSPGVSYLNHTVLCTPRLSQGIHIMSSVSCCRYLHEVCLPSVVHRNFKSSNILLDEEHNPHLSDCGLAALTPNTERQVNTSLVLKFFQIAMFGICSF